MSQLNWPSNLLRNFCVEEAWTERNFLLIPCPPVTAVLGSVRLRRGLRDVLVMDSSRIKGVYRVR